MSNGTERDYWTGGGAEVWRNRQADLDRLMAAVNRLLVDRAAPANGARVLDVGCGTGASTLAVARALGGTGDVTGWDLSRALLDAARARAAAAGLTNMSFVEGDAESDPVPGAPFEAMISRFGVMFFTDPVVGLSNIAAQLGPGARLTFVAWGAAADNPWFALPHRLAEARLGPGPRSEPDAPGPTAFRDPARVTALMERAGLAEAGGEVCDIALDHPGGPATIADLAVAVGPAARLLRLSEAGESERAALRSDIEAALGGFAAPEGIRIPARVIVYSARAR